MAFDKSAAPQKNRKRRKVCQFCVDKAQYIDYKDAAKLRKYLSERSKILPRRTTGTCAYHQRMLTEAIKRSRQVALLPYVTD
ncbi:MAG: 30S ribosomal protein S18 [Oscillospiraceae bacterium]|nr:30S ribosomal protein S18 [Oscillospiraceae bacterium]